MDKRINITERDLMIAKLHQQNETLSRALEILNKRIGVLACDVELRARGEPLGHGEEDVRR